MDIRFIHQNRGNSSARTNDIFLVLVKENLRDRPNLLGLSSIAATHKPKLSPNGEVRGYASNQLQIEVHVTNCE
jgi:hypothetical protein